MPMIQPIATGEKPQNLEMSKNRIHATNRESNQSKHQLTKDVGGSP